MNMGNGTKHHMWMFFHVQPADTVLFSFWNVENVSGMLVACFILLCLALIFEVLKWLRVVLEQRRTMWPGLLADTAANNYARALFAPGHLAQTGLYFLQLLLSYVLMLAVMTFSVWILLAISGGAAIGYWLFGRRKPVMVLKSASTGGAAGSQQQQQEIH